MTHESRAIAVKQMLAERERTGAIDYRRWSKSLATPEGTLRSWVSRAKDAPLQQPVAKTQQSATGEADKAKREKEREELGIPEGLTPKQWEAMQALLAGQGTTAVAKALEVGLSSLYRWQALPAWQVAWEVERIHLMQETRARLHAAAPRAVETLGDVMDDSEAPASSKVSAAVAVLDRTGFGTKSSLELTGPNGGPVQVLHGITDGLLRALETLHPVALALIEAGRWEPFERLAIRAAIEAGEVSPDCLDAEIEP